MPGGGIRLRSCVALERELQAKLNQTRVVQLAGDQAKRVSSWGPVVRGAGESKLGPVKGIEELSPELNAKLVVRTELGSLEDRQVPVVDSRRTERGINTSLSPITVIRWRSEASRIKGFSKFGDSAPCWRRFVASGNHVGANV